MCEKKGRKFSKLSRQLVLFHIFSSSKVIELMDVTKLFKISNKTIMRDLKELQQAGLLHVTFSKKEKGFIHTDDANRCPSLTPVFSDNEARNRHLQKLIRLATIMVELKNHTEVPCYENEEKNQETCSNWYKKRFPALSIRTMQRDFQELNKIGYEIKYDPYDKFYIVDFPEGLEGIEYRLIALQTERSI